MIFCMPPVLPLYFPIAQHPLIHLSTTLLFLSAQPSFHNEIVSCPLGRQSVVLFFPCLLRRYRPLSAECAAAEECLNDGLGRISELVRDTAAATHSLSCGMNDMDRNEAKYLQEALDLFENVHHRVTHREKSEVILVNPVPHAADGAKAVWEGREDTEGLSGGRSMILNPNSRR